MVAKVCKSDMLCKQTSWHRNSIDAYWCYMKARTRGSTSLWHATSSYFPQVWCSIKYQRVSAHRCFMFYMKAGRRKTPFKLPNAFRSSTTKQRWGRSTHNHTLNHCFTDFHRSYCCKGVWTGLNHFGSMVGLRMRRVDPGKTPLPFTPGIAIRKKW